MNDHKPMFNVTEHFCGKNDGGVRVMAGEPTGNEEKFPVHACAMMGEMKVGVTFGTFDGGGALMLFDRSLNEHLMIHAEKPLSSSLSVGPTVRIYFNGPDAVDIVSSTLERLRDAMAKRVKP